MAAKNKGGRKGKYQEWLTPEGLLLIEGWARDGLTDEQIAQNMGIAVRTLYNWQDKYVQIVQSLKAGKEVVDRQVENALLKRALGFEVKEVTQERVFVDELGIYEMAVTKVVTKQVTPDTTAGIFWLKNRKPNEWRDRHEVKNEHTGKDGEPLQVLFNISRPKPKADDSNNEE